MSTNRYDASIKQYVEQGGQLFTIKFIDTIRDGGTKIISATNGNSYYIHQNDNTIHTAYPLKSDNKIKDKLFKDVILDRIETYIEHSENLNENNKNLLNRLILK